MGTNRRYAHRVDRMMDDRILERTVLEAGPLQTLSMEELDLDREPLTVDPVPKPVRAWVRFGDMPLQVDAIACRWTPRAVGIQFAIRDRQFRAWVWASAVTARAGDVAAPS